MVSWIWSGETLKTYSFLCSRAAGRAIWRSIHSRSTDDTEREGVRREERREGRKERGGLHSTPPFLRLVSLRVIRSSIVLSLCWRVKGFL